MGSNHGKAVHYWVSLHSKDAKLSSFWFPRGQDSSFRKWKHSQLNTHSTENNTSFFKTNHMLWDSCYIFFLLQEISESHSWQINWQRWETARSREAMSAVKKRTTVKSALGKMARIQHGLKARPPPFPKVRPVPTSPSVKQDLASRKRFLSTGYNYHSFLLRVTGCIFRWNGSKAVRFQSNIPNLFIKVELK